MFNIQQKKIIKRSGKETKPHDLVRKCAAIILYCYSVIFALTELDEE